MKNIKVNITNPFGKKTSTTINVNIATFYYKFCVPQSEKDFIKEIDDVIEQINAAIAFRNKCLQDFVNRLIDEVTTYKDDFQMEGVDQQMIEIRLLNAIKYSN